MAPAPPILIYTPGGGVPVGPVSNPPVYSQHGTTQLVNGQAYIDVVFGSVQTTDEWVLVECVVVNEIDAEPLNIWPGIITDKAQAGFRLQLNGMPDSSNYYLHWAVSGVNLPPTPPTPATTYTLSGPTTGNISTASSNFTVRLPTNSTVAAPVVVTPNDGGVGTPGTFTPSTVTLTTGSPSATFTYTPASYGVKTISTTNDGSLTDPAGLIYTCVASTYTLTGPGSGSTGVASTNFTVALPVGGVVLATVTVTPSDGGDGGTFTPTTRTLTTAAPSATFTYTPATDGTKPIGVTNNGGLTNPGNISYVASTPFSPGSIAGLKLWLKADSLALTDGAAVTTWTDSSGNGHDATGTATFKTAIVNGKPVIRFNGTTDTLLVAAPPVTPQPNTVLFVGKQSGFPTIAAYFITGSGPQYIACEANGTFKIYAGANLAGSVDHHAAFHCFTAKVSSGVGTTYVDGTLEVSGAIGGGTLSGVTFSNDIAAGGSNYSPVDLAEVLVYNSALSDTDRGNVENYLMTKYGL